MPSSITTFFDKPIMIRVGAVLIPAVNILADTLTGFKQSDWDVNLSRSVYPGHSYCKQCL